MNKPRQPEKKIYSINSFLKVRKNLRAKQMKLVFTNGCFDFIHTGHVDYLYFSRKQGDALVVGLNSDKSVRRNKGKHRPINNEQDRAIVLASIECVDYVIIFGEDEPKHIIAKIIPDVLVKGADWAHYVSGREVVEKNGGKVVLAKLVKGKSTTKMIERMQISEDKS